MKFAAFLAVVVLSLSACTGGFDGTIGVDDVHNPATAGGTTDTTMLPRMEFDDVRYDFGKITQGERVPLLSF